MTVRPHSRKYRDKWFTIGNRFPHVKFYSYTNSIPLFRNVKLPDNFVQSIQTDKLKDTTDKFKERHSIVFKSLDDMLAEGYTNAPDNDLMATKWFNKTNKVGLKFH